MDVDEGAARAVSLRRRGHFHLRRPSLVDCGRANERVARWIAVDGWVAGGGDGGIGKREHRSLPAELLRRRGLPGPPKGGRARVHPTSIHQLQDRQKNECIECEGASAPGLSRRLLAQGESMCDFTPSPPAVELDAGAVRVDLHLSGVQGKFTARRSLAKAAH